MHRTEAGKKKCRDASYVTNKLEVGQGYINES